MNYLLMNSAKFREIIDRTIITSAEKALLANLHFFADYFSAKISYVLVQCKFYHTHYQRTTGDRIIAILLDIDEYFHYCRLYTVLVIFTDYI